MGEPTTLSIVWRCSGRDFDVDRMLSEVPGLTPDLVFHSGEESRRGKHDESGLNVSLLEDLPTDQVEAALGSCLDNLALTFAKAHDRGGTSVIDVAVMLDVESLAAGFALNDALLRRLSDARLGLVVSVYAASGDVL
jgi:hypothetical protein